MNVSTLVFLGLAVVWAIVLLPEVLRKLSGVRGSDTIRSFNQQLAVLDRTGRQRGNGRDLAPVSPSNVIDLGSRRRPLGPPAAPKPVPYSVRRRRQEVLTALGAAALLTLLCTVAFGGFFLVLHLLADLALVAYVVELARVKQTAPSTRSAQRRPAGLGGPVFEDHVRSAPVGRTMPAARRIAN